MSINRKSINCGSDELWNNTQQFIWQLKYLNISVPTQIILNEYSNKQKIHHRMAIFSFIEFSLFSTKALMSQWCVHNQPNNTNPFITQLSLNSTRTSITATDISNRTAKEKFHLILKKSSLNYLLLDMHTYSALHNFSNHEIYWILLPPFPTLC